METPKHRGPRPIGDAIQGFLRETGLGLSVRDARIFRAWKEALDPVTEAKTTPVGFRQGTLTIEVSSAPLLAELRNFRGESLRTKLNSAFPEPPVRRIVFKSRSN